MVLPIRSDLSTLICGTYVSSRWQGTNVNTHQKDADEYFPVASQRLRIFVAQGRYHRFQSTEGAIQAQSDQHQEEYYGPEHRARHCCDGLGIHDEDQAWT